jgi:hypothetical protein
VPYTRSCEYQYIPWKPRRPANQTASTLIFEYPSTEGEPYYPVPNPRNQELFKKYQALAEQEEKEKRVYFIGRLANYKYFNMDDAALNALNFYEKLYGETLPVIDQTSIYITPTWPGKGQATKVTPLKGQFYEVRYEARLWSLCQLGHQIKQAGTVYWIVVEDGEQPDSLVKDLIFSFGFQHYAYWATGPTNLTGEPDVAALYKNAREYIAVDGMDVNAKVVEMLDTAAETSAAADAFCTEKLKEFGLSRPNAAATS